MCFFILFRKNVESQDLKLLKDTYWEAQKIRMAHMANLEDIVCTFLHGNDSANTLPETSILAYPWKFMGGRRSFPFWDAIFSGAILVAGRAEYP